MANIKKPKNYLFSKDEFFIGAKLKRWTIIGGPRFSDKWRDKLWECRCECGKIREVNQKNIQTGVSSGCINCRTIRLINPSSLIGVKINEWTVQTFIGSDLNSYKFTIACSCGASKEVNASAIRLKRIGKCNKCEELSERNPAKRNLWHKITWAASVRNIPIEISWEEAFNLLEKQKYRCALSGIEIYIAKSTKERLANATTASLDRIDSSKSYSLENVQWLHKTINKMKWELSQNEFINLCKVIWEHNKDGENV